MTLRIGVDARTILLEKPTGVERVAHHFIESLSRIAPAHQEFRFYVDREPGARRDAAPDVDYEVVPDRSGPLRALGDFWMAWTMRGVMERDGLDAFLSLNTKFPFSRKPCFTAVHGLEWYFCPAEYRLAERVRQWTWFQLSTRYCSGLITFAEHTREDIRRVRPTSTVPTCVVPEGIHPLFRRLGADERSPAALERLGVRAPYVLSVCSHEPRKNLDALIRAFARAVTERDLPHQLVLVGRAGHGSRRLDEAIAQSGAGDRVLRTGYVSDEDLLQIYNHADLFVYPSKYEGFGLPLVEAMACGVAIVTSNTSSMKEVAGDAAVLIDPHSERDLQDAIARCLTDRALRERLAEAGTARSSAFTWDGMTRGICDFLDERLGAR